MGTVSELPRFQGGDQPFQLMQSQWQGILNPLLKNPITAGITVSGISLSAGSNIINTTLARPYQGWIIIGESPKNPAVTGAWSDWTPTYSASGSMTFTSVTTRVARYAVQNNIVYFYIRAGGTTGGTASNTLLFTLPVSAAAAPGGFPASNAYQLMAAHISDSTEFLGSWFIVQGDQTHGKIQKTDGTNFGLGASREFYLNGFYELDLTSSSVNGSDVWEGPSTDKSKFLNLYANGPMTINLYIF